MEKWYISLWMKFSSLWYKIWHLIVSEFLSMLFSTTWLFLEHNTILQAWSTKWRFGNQEDQMKKKKKQERPAQWNAHHSLKGQWRIKITLLLLVRWKWQPILCENIEVQNTWVSEISFSFHKESLWACDEILNHPCDHVIFPLEYSY